jgi:hypothetical protein
MGGYNGNTHLKYEKMGKNQGNLFSGYWEDKGILGLICRDLP